MTFSEAEKLEAIRRELRQRRRVYPRLVATGRMSEAEANRQIALMLAIEADYTRQVEGERLL